MFSPEAQSWEVEEMVKYWLKSRSVWFQSFSSFHYVLLSIRQRIKWGMCSCAVIFTSQRIPDLFHQFWAPGFTKAPLAHAVYHRRVIIRANDYHLRICWWIGMERMKEYVIIEWRLSSSIWWYEIREGNFLYDPK